MSDVPTILANALADRYALDRVIGQGGMATVYGARDVRHGRVVAVKVLRPELAAAIGTERFLKEIEIAAGLTHPNILTLIDSGTVAGQQGDQAVEFLYYVMPFITGESLRDLLLRRLRLEPNEALPIIKEAADALSYAHRQGLVHRDVKPENILLSEGHAVVTDFGIAKAVITAGGEQLTRSGFPLGTPGYMSPEQAAGRADLDATTDVYGLACVLYEMLVGETPGMWLEAEAVKLGRFTEASSDHRAALDKLPGRLERVLVKALAMRPSLRYGTPTEFAFDVESCLEHRPMYREAEAKQLIERAAELEIDNPTQGSEYALSMGGVQRVAAEAGIRPELVEEAARRLEPHEEGLVPGGVLGIRQEFVLERRADVSIARADYAAVLDEIRTTLGEMGQLEATLDDSFAWSSNARSSGRRAHILVGPSPGGTRIRIRDNDVAPAGIIFAPLGAGSAVLVGITGAIVSGAGLTDLTAAVAAGVVGLTAFFSGWGGLRFLHRRQMQRRFEKLTGLIARLESIVRDRGTNADSGARTPKDDERATSDG
jgi:hypothetical protein